MLEYKSKRSRRPSDRCLLPPSTPESLYYTLTQAEPPPPDKGRRRRRRLDRSSMLNLSGSSGLPLCISGITRSIPFPKQMADHDRRRKSVTKKMRSHSRSQSNGGENPSTAAASLRREMGEEALSDLIRDLCYCIPLPCAAKAA